MGWLEASVSLATGLAWPSVVVVAVLILRKEIGQLIARMTRFKGPGVEADFPRQAAATNELSEEAVPEASTKMALPATNASTDGLRPTESLTLEDFRQEAEVHPVGAVVRAWQVVENTATQVFRAEGLTLHGGRHMSVVNIVRELRAEGLVSDDVVALAGRLTRLRIQVVYLGTIPNAESARDFVEAAWRLAVALNLLRTPLGGSAENTS